MTAEDEEGLEKKEGGKEKIDFGMGVNKGDNAAANSAEDAAGPDGKIKLGCRRGTNSDAASRMVIPHDFGLG